MSLIEASRAAQAAKAAEHEAAMAAAAAETAEAVNEMEEKKAQSMWSQLVERRKSRIEAVSFFKDKNVRQLRPHRLQSVGTACASTDKWSKLRGTLAVMSEVKDARVRVRAKDGAGQEFKVGEAHHAFHLQGDQTMHTQEVWRARMDLSTDPMVTQELHNWWVMVRTAFTKTPAEAAQFEGLTETMYGKLQLRLYKALISPFDPMDARKCAREEWKTDRRGGALVGRVQLCDSLFEMTDLWTNTVRAEEYALFLRLLFDQITTGDPPKLKSLAAIKAFDAAGEAARITDEQEATRAAHANMTKRRSQDFSARMGRSLSNCGMLSAQERAIAERAAAAAATRELANEEEAAAEAVRALERVQEEAEEAERAAEAAKRAEAAARAAAEAAERREALAAALAARRTPHGVWPNGVPADVMACWARKAVKPSREHFARPTGLGFKPAPPTYERRDLSGGAYGIALISAAEQSGTFFRPSSARMGHSPRALPPAAVAMQIAAWRTAPGQVRTFYEAAAHSAAKTQPQPPPGLPCRPHTARERRPTPALSMVSSPRQ